MKLTNKIKNNVLSFIIGGIIFGGISYTVASQILATQVSYSYEDSLSNVTNVSTAITELYGLAEECQNTSSSGGGITYYGKDAVAVYLDPTGNATNCSSSNFTSDTGTKSGCMRFYVYAEDSEYKYAILDHNTTAMVSSCPNSNCFAKAQSQVKQDTASWNPNLQARNISAMEVYKITESTNNQTNWQIKNGSNFYFNAKNGSNAQGYGWLFDRIDRCQSYGCTTNDSSNFGYWTSDAYGSSKAWNMAYNGGLTFNSFSTSLFGVRPVIKISKS